LVSSAIPRHSFFLWLAFHNAISTREKTCGWRYGACAFSAVLNRKAKLIPSLIVASVGGFRDPFMSDCSVSNPPTGWDDVVLWSVAELQGRSLKSCVCNLCFGAAVYRLWLQKNVILHGKTPRTEE